MYSLEELGPNLILSPASGNINFHNAYDGGYVDHILNVVENSLKVLELYTEIGINIDFTTDELLFSAFHHDLGKLGIKGDMEYQKNPSDWHVKNQGKLYVRNPKIKWLNHTDRTYLLLNQYEIQLSEKEYMGIKLTDGLYDDDAKKYLITYDRDKHLSSNMHLVLHQADMISSVLERELQQNAPF